MIKLLRKLSAKEFLIIIVSIALITVQVWLDLKMPDYMSKITRLVQAEDSGMRDILTQGGYMLLCSFGSLASAIFVGYLASYIAASFSKRIRKLLFDKVGNFSTEEIKKFSTSSLITRTTNDITQVQMLISMGLQLLIKSPIMIVWAILKIVNKSWQWSAVTGGAVALLLMTISLLIILVLPKFKVIQKYIDNINKIARENLTGIRIVRAYNAEEYQQDKFEGANNVLTKTNLFTQKSMAIMQPMMFLIMYLLTLSIYFVGAYLINSADMFDRITLFGDMVVFSAYAMQIIMSVLMLAMIFIIYPRTSVSAKRINDVLDEEIKIKDGTMDKDESNLKGVIELKNVSFKYPDAEEYAVKNVSLKIEKGETIAFIGSTGSGKSTLINLIPRFYDVTEGEILLDGIDVREYKQELLHNKIGYVPQKAIMFSGTVMSNVSYGDSGKEENKEEMIKALEIAQAKEFVENMDEKYDSHIAQSGTNISGGQKQRLAIARVIARKPEIYIFDDTFSALDYKTDSVLRKQLKEYTKDTTTLIVAQRIGTIMNADKIVVLDNGSTVGIGTHSELLKNCEVYKQIATSQLSKEELENG